MASNSTRYDRVVNLSPYSRERIMLDWIGKDRRVLELGCSTGFFSRAMASQGCRVVGVEFDPVAARSANGACESVFIADLNSPQWAAGITGGFDVILMADVLEHLMQPDRVLGGCRKLLQPGGFIVVSLPNVTHWRNRLNVLMGRWEYTETGTLDRTHLHFFTVKTSRELIESAGYEIQNRHITAGFGSQRILRPLLLGIANHLAPNLLGYQLMFKATPVRKGTS